MRPCTVLAEKVIDATPEQVWDVIADVMAWRSWSQSFWFTRARQEIGGAALLWACPQPPLPALPIPVRFQVIEPNQELRWGGGVPGIAQGSHYLKLEALSDGRTRVLHGEDFGGISVRLSWPLLGRLLPGAYRRFTEEIAAEVALRVG